MYKNVVFSACKRTESVLQGNVIHVTIVLQNGALSSMPKCCFIRSGVDNYGFFPSSSRKKRIAPCFFLVLDGGISTGCVNDCPRSRPYVCQPVG